MKLRHILVCLILCAIAGSAFSADYQPRYLEITFLTTNDLHGKLWPYDIPPDPAKNYPGIKNIGGAARRATAIRQVRSGSRNPVLLLDLGDTTYSNTALGKAYRGLADIAVLNAARYDAMAPGNHEFNLHANEIMKNKSSSAFPWVCANMVYEKTGTLFTDPYIIREIGGVRVAMFGLINNEPKNNPKYYVGAPELGLTVLPATDVAKRLVPELRAKADIVVLLSHLGRVHDAALAQAAPGIDIILGGHSHSVLRTPQMVKVGEPSAYSLGVVPVVQAGYWGQYMGRTKVIFHRNTDGRYTLMNCKGDLITIDETIPDDSEIAKILADWTARIPPPAKPAAPAQPVSK